MVPNNYLRMGVKREYAPFLNIMLFVNGRLLDNVPVLQKTENNKKKIKAKHSTQT